MKCKSTAPFGPRTPSPPPELKNRTAPAAGSVALPPPSGRHQRYPSGLTGRSWWHPLRRRRRRRRRLRTRRVASKTWYRAQKLPVVTGPASLPSRSATNFSFWLFSRRFYDEKLLFCLIFFSGACVRSLCLDFVGVSVLDILLPGGYLI